MSPNAFTSTEHVASVGKSLRTLSRLVRSIPLLQKLFFPTVVLSVVAVVLPQIFLWLAGLLVQCQGKPDCNVTIPGIDVSIGITMGMLVLLALTSFVVRLASWIVFEIGGLWSLQDFHQKMVAGLQRVRTTYYDENPSGRLINRLVNDYENLRTSCIVRIGDTIQALLEVLSIAAMVLFAHPIGAALIFPTVALFLYIQWSVAPMLQRLTTVRSIRLGEVIHRETDLIDGARTFVLYEAEQALLARLRTAVRRYVQIHILRVKIEAWGRVLSSSVTSLYSFLSLVLIALAVRSGSLSLVMGSAIVTIVLRMTPACSWLAWSVSLLIESVGVAKRAFEIVDLPDQVDEEFASQRESKEDVVKLDGGELSFVDYSMSYRSDSPVILKNVSFTVPRASKVGLVGRTGSGKTSLLQSLFRMVHVRSGDILLNGVSLLDADVRSVRELFGVVPQDPYLFAGTVRSNLDPEMAASVHEIEAAMRTVGLDLPLDAPVVEGGKNLSVGERQLLCLARVIVKKHPFILLDEPTSAVDNITDAQIQRALDTAFTDRTVIAIAHRLETLSHYDQLIELRDGAVARVGLPGAIIPTLSRADVEGS